MSVISPIMIQVPQTQHIAEIVDIHQAVLGYTLNSRLGKAHLAFMYQSLLHSPDCCVLVALEGETPVGVISGALDVERTRLQLQKQLTWAGWGRLFFGFLRNPLLIREWLKNNFITKPIYVSGEIVNATLTTIAIRMDRQKKGIGLQLVGTLEEYFLRQNVKVYRLDTLISNTGARSFYKNLGFQEVEHRADSVVMIKRMMNS